MRGEPVDPAIGARPSGPGSVRGEAAAPGGRAILLGRLATAVWVVIVLGALGYRLGAPALIDPDEGRNAEVAREMQAGGGWVLPTLDGLPYLDKPVLFFAAGAVGISVLGPTETAVRAPALLFTVLTLLLVFWFARRVFGPTEAWIAAFAAAASPLTIAFARTVIFDSALTFFVVLALIAFFAAIEGRVANRGEGGRATPRPVLPWTVLAWAAMGLGILTKGPVALALPLLVAAPYAMWRRAAKAVWHPLGIVVLLAVAVPWVWAVDRRVPGFLRYALLTETWGRLTTQELKRGGPIWYFLPVLLWGAFPWVVVAAAAAGRRLVSWWRRRRVSPPEVFLLLWVLLPLLFFSLSQSKRPQYILPVIPALALLVARWWATSPGRRATGARAGAIALVVGGGLLLAVGIAVMQRPALAPVAAELGARTALILGGVAVVAGLLAWTWSGRWRLCLVALSVPALAIPVVGMPLLREVAAGRSTRTLAPAVRQAVPVSGRLLGVDAFAPSLLFYLERPMLVATGDGAALRSNYVIHAYDRLLTVPGSPLRRAGFWLSALQECRAPTVFFVESRDRAVRDRLHQAGLRVVGSTRHWAAYGPCAPATEADVAGEVAEPPETPPAG